jgi:hypothetical protein
MDFYSEFWRDVGKLSATLSNATPLVGSLSLQDFLIRFADASSEHQQRMKHELGITIARLIQLDRAIHVATNHPDPRAVHEGAQP